MGKQRVPRTRNSGTMTEAAFRGWVRSQLRKMSQRWRPISDCKKRVKSPVTADDREVWGNRIRYVYICEKCGARVPEKEGAVDHVIPAGSLTDIERDAGPFITRLLVEDDGSLQWLCNPCHAEKTKEERDGRTGR